MEAHNFLPEASITLTHSKNEKKWDAKSVALVKSLAKLVFSIGTTTLKVTKEDMDESKKMENSNGNEDQVQRNEKRAVIKGMGMLIGANNKTMTTKTGEEGKNEEMADEGSKWSRSSKSKKNKFKDQDEDMNRAGAYLTARMAEVLADLANTSEADTTLPMDPLSNDEAGKDYSKDNSGAKSGDDDLSLSDYGSDALEVSSREFEAAHGQK